MATRQTALTRARDDDRTKTCQILDSALGDGQLSMDEHRQRVQAATTAATLGALQNLIDDLQTENAPVQLPQLKKPVPRLAARAGGGGLWFPIAVSAVFVLLGILIGWGLYGNSSSPLDFTTDPGAKPDGIAPVVVTAPKELQSLGGLSGLYEQMRQKFGDTTGYSLTIRPDRADLERADPRDDRRVLSYDYRGGWGDPSSATKSSDDRTVDLAKFDWAKIVGLLRGAPDMLQMGSQKITDTRIDVEPSKDPLTPDAVSLSLYVTGEFGSGYLQVGPDGAIKMMSPPS